MSSLTRLSVLMLSMSLVLCAASGASVSWTLYNDTTCTTQLTSGASSAVVGTGSIITPVTATFCIPITTIAGVQSARASCLTGPISRNQTLNQESLGLYSDTNCSTSVTNPTLIGDTGTCGTSQPTTYGALSAVITCSNSAVSLAVPLLLLLAMGSALMATLVM